MSLATLKIEAKLSAKYRGHRMWHFRADLVRRTFTARCLRCKRSVTVIPKPWPNEIEISGEAVAVNCNLTSETEINMPTYTVSAGRVINRDGRPFVSLNVCRTEIGGANFPITDADAFAHTIAAQANLQPELIAALRGLLAARYSVTQGQERELYEEWLPKARAALAKAGVL